MTDSAHNELRHFFVVQSHSLTFDICTTLVEKISITDILSILLYIKLLLHSINFHNLQFSNSASQKI